MKLTKKVKRKLKGEILMRVCIDSNVPHSTMQRWIKKDYTKGLSRLQVWRSIQQHTGESDIFKETEKKVEL